MGADSARLILMLFGLCSLLIILAGATNKVVVYYDKNDLSGTFLSVALIGVAFVVANTSPFESSEYNSVYSNVFGPLVGLVGGALAITSIVRSVRNNKSIVIGVFVGVFRIIYAALAIFFVIDAVGRISSSESSRREGVAAAVMISVIAIITKLMINGRKVYSAKGWELPATNSANTN